MKSIFLVPRGQAAKLDSGLLLEHETRQVNRGQQQIGFRPVQATTLSVGTGHRKQREALHLIPPHSVMQDTEKVNWRCRIRESVMQDDI
jgi:hypothetical protein